jgi:hypothetical protein
VQPLADEAAAYAARISAERGWEDLEAAGALAFMCQSWLQCLA